MRKIEKKIKQWISGALILFLLVSTVPIDVVFAESDNVDWYTEEEQKGEEDKPQQEEPQQDESQQDEQKPEEETEDEETEEEETEEQQEEQKPEEDTEKDTEEETEEGQQPNEETDVINTPESNRISGTIWFDGNANGIRDDNEQGIESFPVKLYMEDTYQEEVTTDEFGTYVFEDIAAGTYVVGIESTVIGELEYLLPLYANADDNKFAMDSEGTGAYSDGIGVTENSDITNVDAGMRLPVEIMALTDAIPVPVEDYAGLKKAINSAGEKVIIEIKNDIELAGTIKIPIEKEIVIQSSEGNKFKLTKSRSRHFEVSGTLTLNNITLNGANDKGKANGGGVEVKDGGTLTMDDGAIIELCKGANGGGVEVGNGGILTMNDGAIIEFCKGTTNGSGVHVAGQYATFTMNDDAIIQSCEVTQYGGGVYLYDGQFTMNDDARIQSCTGIQGGGVYVTGKNAKFTLNGGIIGGGETEGNTAESTGGGVRLGNEDACTFNMTGGVISGNTARGNGGGVHRTGGTFTMSGGTISDNTASLGGGVYAGMGNVSKDKGPAFVMNGSAKIINNRSKATTFGGGGGVYIGFPCDFEMSEEAEISGNIADNEGGGVYVRGSGKGSEFTMSGSAKISDNIARNNGGVGNGGGVYVGERASLTMSDSAKISGNRATKSGGGVYVERIDGGVGILEMSDSAKISGNTATTYGGGVYNAGTVKMTDGTIGGKEEGNTATGSGGGIYSFQGTIVMEGGAISYNESKNNGGGIFVDNSTFTLTNGEISNNCATGSGGWSGGGGIYINGSGTAYLNGGTVKGNTASTRGGGIFTQGTVEMKDGTIEGNKADTSGGGVYMYEGTFKMTGGTIGGEDKEKGNKGPSGGGVFISTGTFTMDSDVAKISNNEATTGSGGGVYVSAGNLKMEKGTINDNTAMNQGGGVYNHSTFTMTGGTISGGKTKGESATSNGGGVYNSGSFTMSGGTIGGEEKTNGNTASGHGGGVYNGKIFKMTGGTIINNTAESTGGGVYNLSTFDMSGFAAIIGNTGQLGGGVRNYDGAELTMKESAKISGNHATVTNGGGVRNTGTFAMDGGTIESNTAAQDGGGVSTTKTFTMNGGVISDNVATTKYGGGVSNTGIFEMTGGTISGNRAETFGGGVCNTKTFTMSGAAEISGNVATIRNGGGVHNQGTFTMANGTISGNSALNGSGGGINNNTKGTFKMDGGTISGNSAPNGSGGGIYATDYTGLTIAAAAEFSKNSASVSCAFDATKDASDYTNIMSRSATDSFLHPLNNYDINYFYMDAALGVTKELTGRTLKDDEFTFTAILIKGDDTKIEGLETGNKITATNKGSKVEFENLTYKAVDTYIYEISEANGGQTIENVTYDENKYYAAVTFDNEGEKVAYYGKYETPGNEGEKVLSDPIPSVTFKNVYGNTGGSGTGTTKYAVTYDANGGRGGTKISVASDKTHDVYTYKQADVSRKNYTFLEWNTKANGNGKSYDAGDSITITERITLYAQWEKKAGSDEPDGDELDSETSVIVADQFINGLLNTEEHIAYISGYSDGGVRADRTITRAEVAAIFYRLLNDQGTAAGGEFNDVLNSAWYAQAVNYLASMDIVAGYKDGTFRPDVQITRAEFATIAAKFDQLVTTDSNNFSDVSDSHWAVKFINSAYSKGWISGYPDGTFCPDNSITRAEVVTVVNAMLGRAMDEDTLEITENPFNDITSSHWAYANVIEASVEHAYIRDKDEREVWIDMSELIATGKEVRLSAKSGESAD